MGDDSKVSVLRDMEEGTLLTDSLQTIDKGDEEMAVQPTLNQGQHFPVNVQGKSAMLITPLSPLLSC